MTNLRRRINQGWTGLGMVGIVVLASTGHGCATADHDGDYTDPPGFSPEHTQAVALSTGGFVRDEQNRLLTATLSNQRQMRQADRRALDERSPLANDRLKLSAEFHGSYADGMTVAAASQPRASLRVVPVAAQKAHPRLRNDGAIVAFEDAFPHVTSAFGARSSRVEEFLVVNDEHDVPTLAYDLVPGEDFDHLEMGDNGDPTLWAYARDGEGLFTILPPSADDAAGRHVEGSWKLDKTAQGYRITAQLDLTGMTYPVLIDPTFETPNWFRNTTGQPSAREAAAGVFDPSTNCTIIFGGIAETASFSANSQMSVRCANRSWGANISSGGPDGVPEARSFATLGYDPTSQQVVLFGGRNNTSVLNDTWALKLTCATPGVGSTCTGVWTKLTSANSPSARFMQGMANDGSRLLMFGGVEGSGAGARDTWSVSVDTASKTATWTVLCDPSNPSSPCVGGGFGGDFGLYGFATATVINGSQRDIYATGGYSNPQVYGPYFANTVFHWNGSGWDDTSGAQQTIPLVPDTDRGTNGVTVLDFTAADLAPQPRYLHWSVGTNNGLMLFGGGFSSTTPAAPATPVDQFYGDSWLWLDASRSGIDNQWLLLPRPRLTANGPAQRQGATAVFDENLREVVLFGGLQANLTTLVNDARVYRGVEDSFRLLQACTDDACSLLNLTAIIDSATTATQCANYTVQFLIKSTSTTPWAYRGAQGAGNTNSATPTWGVPPNGVTTTTSCYLTSADLSVDLADYGARVRNNPYHQGGTRCANSAGEVTSNGLPSCLQSGGGYVGVASCGGPLISAGDPVQSCDFY